MNFLIGSHVPMKSPKYLLGSVNETINNNSNCMMIYTGAPQNSIRTATENLQIPQMKEKWKQNNLEKIIVHAPYIINLANTFDSSKIEFASSFLIKEVIRADKIGAKCIVLHPGAHVKAGSEKGIEQIVKSLDIVFESTKETKVNIALETMSGKGTEVAKNFDEISKIINTSKYSNRITVCLDTCHVHDSGYDIVNSFDEVLEEIDKKIGINKLDVIHLNDSKNIMGAKKDRHENIGYGYIGFEALNNIAHHPKLKNIPKILETPFINKKISPYSQEIEMLKAGLFYDFIKEINENEK